MPIVTFGRGFKVPVVKFDEFLIANHGQETFGGTIQPDESDDISQIIRDQGVDADIRVFRPSRMGFGYPKYLFVCFAWVNVYAWRNVDEYLEKPVPTGFEDFMKSLVPDAAISTFVVFNEEDLWLPDPLYATEQTPQPPCEICGEPTENWDECLRHRQEVHGAGPNEHALPEY